MEAIATASITSAFGNGFLSEFIRDTYSFLKDSSRYPEVQEVILKLDLKNFIPLTQNLINFLETQKLPIHIKFASDQFKISVQLIKDQLAFIYNALTIHKNKFLHRIRPPSLGKHLQKLIILKENADKQMNYIFHLLPDRNIKNDNPNYNHINDQNKSADNNNHEDTTLIKKNDEKYQNIQDPLNNNPNNI